jgi:hypothetical protein
VIQALWSLDQSNLERATGCVLFRCLALLSKAFARQFRHVPSATWFGKLDVLNIECDKCGRKWSVSPPSAGRSAAGASMLSSAAVMTHRYEMRVDDGRVPVSLFAGAGTHQLSAAPKHMHPSSLNCACRHLYSRQCLCPKIRVVCPRFPPRALSHWDDWYLSCFRGILD